MFPLRSHGRFLRTIAWAALFVVLPATVALGGVLEEKLRQTRTQGKAVKQEMSVVQQRQQALVKQISAINARLARMQEPIDRLDAEIDQLGSRIDGREGRIEKLKADYSRQAKEIVRLTAEHDAAQGLLQTRVVAAYKGGDTGMMEQLAGAGSLRDLFERQEALGQVVGLDQEVIDRITGTQRAVRLKRAGNHQLRRDIRADIKSLEGDRADVTAKRATLQAKLDEVASVKATRDAALKKLRSRKHQLDEKLDDLEHDAAALQEAIRTGAVTYAGAIGNVSPAGLIWPVNGPVVSPFGPRWGRAHEGIDIAISAGNPIHASASGIVTYASWMSGYGNMVLIQHGGGLVTGYAHQSQISVKVGQTVSQGQVIGFVGCTGHCYGDHVHFETRMGESPRDPMQYL